jgi:uncharacterized Zn finger protein
MILYCNRCKGDTLHRRVTERSDPDDPFTYIACYECGEIHPKSFTNTYLK